MMTTTSAGRPPGWSPTAQRSEQRHGRGERVLGRVCSTAVRAMTTRGRGAREKGLRCLRRLSCAPRRQCPELGD